jgi:hypothetical protein
MAVKAPSISFKPLHQGASVIDGKTPVSFAVGFLAGMSGMNASWATVCVVGFEALLVMLDEGAGAAFEKRSPQSYGNQMVDVMVGILGVHYGERFQQAAKSDYTPPTRIDPRAQLPAPREDGGISPELIAASNAGEQAPLTGLNRVRWVR